MMRDMDGRKASRTVETITHGTLESTKMTAALDIGEHLADVAGRVVAGQGAVQRLQSAAWAGTRLGVACGA